VCFGVPLAHDDDAGRSVRAALEVRDGFPRLARHVLPRHGVEIGPRAACLDLDLSRALTAAGAERDASAARERATAVLAPLRCVHAY